MVTIDIKPNAERTSFKVTVGFNNTEASIFFQLSFSEPASDAQVMERADFYADVFVTHRQDGGQPDDGAQSGDILFSPRRTKPRKLFGESSSGGDEK